MRIRSATKNDCQTCYEMSQVPELAPESTGEIRLGYFEEVAASKDAIFLVAEKKGEVIGYSIAYTLPGNLALWWLLAVKKTHRKKSVGTKLAQEVERICKEKGLKFMIGFVLSTSKTALTFHKKQGLKPSKERFFEISKVLG